MEIQSFPDVTTAASFLAKRALHGGRVRTFREKTADGTAGGWLSQLSAWARKNPEIAMALAGGAGGAAFGGLSSLATDEDQRNTPGSAMMGLLAGAGLGGGAGLAMRHWPTLQNALGLGKASPKKTQTGSVADTAGVPKSLLENRLSEVLQQRAKVDQTAKWMQEFGGYGAKDIQQLYAGDNQQKIQAHLSYLQGKKPGTAQPKKMPSGISMFTESLPKREQLQINPEALPKDATPEQLAAVNEAYQANLQRQLDQGMPSMYDTNVVKGLLAGDVAQLGARNYRNYRHDRIGPSDLDAGIKNRIADIKDIQSPTPDTLKDLRRLEAISATDKAQARKDLLFRAQHPLRARLNAPHADKRRLNPLTWLFSSKPQATATSPAPAEALTLARNGRTQLLQDNKFTPKGWAVPRGKGLPARGLLYGGLPVLSGLYNRFHHTRNVLGDYK